MLKFSSKSISEHAEVPLADEGRLESIVAEWDERSQSQDGGGSYVVSASGPAALAEITALVESQGGRVVGAENHRLSRPNPRTFFGSGVAREIAERARSVGATMLVLDAELSPSQARNLEDAAGIPICDREAIILNVFRRQARTRRAKIQVELARLEYLRPRIRGVGLDMDQQTGGTARARGPGETASELLARQLDDRLAELQKSLRKLETSAKTQRRKREDGKRLVLVGYTNAGKTSLMNALTGAGLSARDRPFETLDTTSRTISRHGGDIVISDTVGFIRRLPERLLASFESTLSEVTDATMLVIVVDVSDEERDLKLQTTHALLERLNAAAIPRYYVLNKLDKLNSSFDPAAFVGDYPFSILSAHDALAVSTLEEALVRAVRQGEERLTTFVPYLAAAAFRVVYSRCRVIESVAKDDGLVMTVEGPLAAISQLRKLLS